MYDDVPSRRYLRPVQPHDLSRAPPDAIAHDRAANRSLDAEPKSAFRQVVRFQENNKVGTRSALPGAVDGIEIGFAY
jgi:hypothetical protein